MVASSDIITIVTADKDSVWRIHKPNTSDLLNLFLFILVIQLFERYIFSVFGFFLPRKYYPPNSPNLGIQLLKLGKIHLYIHNLKEALKLLQQV